MKWRGGGKRNDTSTAFYRAQATSKLEFHVCTLPPESKKNIRAQNGPFYIRKQDTSLIKAQLLPTSLCHQTWAEKAWEGSNYTSMASTENALCKVAEAKLSCLIKASFGSSNWPNKLHYQTNTYTQITILLSQVQLFLASGTGACLCLRSDAREHCAGQEQRKTWEWLRNNRNKTQKKFFPP